MRGKVIELEEKKVETKDHPRLCGEKVRNVLKSIIIQGSPPPMRGKASPFRQFQRLSRITPAYAGKS